MPANFPPMGEGTRSLSGMGTPDMHGTQGTFTFFTDDPGREAGPVSGGRIVRVPPFAITPNWRSKGLSTASARGSPPPAPS